MEDPGSFSGKFNSPKPDRGPEAKKRISLIIFKIETAKVFKEPEKGNKDVNILRTEQAIETQPEVIAAGCPFCNTMMTDGVKGKDKEGQIEVMDVAEMIADADDL